MKCCHIILCLIFLVFTQTAEAQFFEKLQKRAEERAQRRVEQKIEKQVDKTVDNTVDAPENAVKKSRKTTKKKAENNPSNDLNSMVDASKSINIQGTFEFQKKVVYVVIDPTSKKANETTYWFGANEEIFGLEMGYDLNTFIVYDLSQDAMMLFSEKDKKLQVMSLSMLGAIYDNSAEDNSEYTFDKVPGKKTINGYICEKYAMSSDSIDGEFWFSKDVDFKVADFSRTFLTMAKTSNQKVPQINPNENGFMMQMIATDTSTNDVTQMTVIEFADSNKTIVTSAYKKQ